MFGILNLQILDVLIKLRKLIILNVIILIKVDTSYRAVEREKKLRRDKTYERERP